MDERTAEIWELHSHGKTGWQDLSDMLANLHSRSLRLEGKAAEADAFDEARSAYVAPRPPIKDRG